MKGLRLRAGLRWGHLAFASGLEKARRSARLRKCDRCGCGGRRQLRRTYAGGFDAGEYNIDSPDSNFGEAVLDNLQAIGIRATSDQRLNRAKSLGSTPSISAITMVGISAALPFYTSIGARPGAGSSISRNSEKDPPPDR